MDTPILEIEKELAQRSQKLEKTRIELEQLASEYESSLELYNQLRKKLDQYEAERSILEV
ncbi:MAG: hypothetical protein AB8B53_01450 [Flavobacteriales bacterium]